MLLKMLKQITTRVSDLIKEVMGEERIGERAAEIEALILKNCGPRKSFFQAFNILKEIGEAWKSSSN